MFLVGFCKPGNSPETGTTQNLWFGVVHNTEPGALGGGSGSWKITSSAVTC